MATNDFVQPPANSNQAGAKKVIIFTGTVGILGTLGAEGTVLCDQDDISTGCNILPFGGVPINYIQTMTGDYASPAATLGNLNDAVVLACGGQPGVSLLLSGGGSLVGTLTPQFSVDGGTTWSNTFFYSAMGRLARSIIFASGGPGSSQQYSILLPSGASHVRVTVSAYTSGSLSAALRASQTAPAQNISFTSRVDGSKATYTAVIHGLALATNATDIVTLTAAPSVVAKILEASVLVFAGGSAAYVDVSIVKRSAANSGGTSGSVTPTPMKTDNPAAAVAVASYTVNPDSLGASLGIIQTKKIAAPTSVTPVVTVPAQFKFGDDSGQALTIEGSEVAAINLNAAVPASSSADVFVRWTEE